MNQNDIFVVRKHPVSLKLVLGLMEDAESSLETYRWSTPALMHSIYTNDRYLYEALERKGIHPYNEYKVEEGEQESNARKTREELEAMEAVIRSQLKTILDNLMQLKAEDDKPLFYQKNHWWAVYRIFVDRKIYGLREKRYQEFIHLINILKLNHLNAELDLSTLSNITQDDVFRLPFSKWQKPWGEGTRKINAYDRMHKIAEELLAMLVKVNLCKSA